MIGQTKSHFSSNDNGITYSTDLGFVPENLGPSVFQQLQRLSGIACGTLVLESVWETLFFLPIAYLGHLLGRNIAIDPYTHHVLMSDTSRSLVELLARSIALLLTCLLVRIAFHRTLANVKLFRRPHAGILPIAIPILSAVGILTAWTEKAVGGWNALFGFPETPISSISASTWLALFANMVYALFRETLFRGILLIPLRRFGDGFAIITTALLSAVTADGLSAGIAVFGYGLAAGYFVLRSGSVRTALLGQLCFSLSGIGLSILEGLADPFLSTLLPLAWLLIILTIAAVVFWWFVRREESAFCLFPSGLSCSTRFCVGVFCSGPCFLILIGFFLYRVITAIQLVG